MDEFPNPFARKRNLIVEAIETHLANELTTCSTRGLTLTPRTLSDNVQRRPYAGKKSHRTHARVWI